MSVFRTINGRGYIVKINCGEKFSNKMASSIHVSLSLFILLIVSFTGSTFADSSVFKLNVDTNTCNISISVINDLYTPLTNYTSFQNGQQNQPSFWDQER